MKRALVCFLSLCLCLLVIWIVKVNICSKNVSDHTNTSAEYSVPRQIQYQFALQNNTDRLIKNAEFWTYAPVRQTPTQRCSHIKSSYSYKLITDVFGNQILHFTFNEFPPYATRIVSVKSELLLSSRANPLTGPDLQVFLGPEKYIESNAPEVRRLARQLKAATPVKTAEKIFNWVAGNVRYAGYLSNDRGALYALRYKKGDCTEFMYLFAALCRANNIPARCVEGYICPEDRILKPGDYHDWAEFYLDGLWRIADPQNRVFMKDQENYIAMRLMHASTGSFEPQFNRFRFKGQGLSVKMNLQP